MSDTPLDNALVNRILENLKVEPSAHLRAMLDQPDGGHWSPEALQAARLLLEQRASGTAAEPEVRTAPAPGRADRNAPPGWFQNGDAVVAPGVLLPRGFAWLVFLTRFFKSDVLYPGIVGNVQVDAVYVRLHNGKRGWARRVDVAPFAIDIGAALFCLRNGKPGTILRSRVEKGEEKFYVGYADGQGEWLDLKELAVTKDRISNVDDR